MQTLLTRFRSYPALLQWLLIGMAAVAVLLLWHDFVWATAKSWDERANEYERALQESERASANLPRTTQEAILAIGDAQPLGIKTDGAQALTREVNAILSRHAVSGQEVKDKAEPFNRNEMPLIIPQGMRGEKLMTEIRFVSTQETAYKVIAELERSPRITTVGSVHIAHTQDPRQENVVTRLMVEAWVITLDDSPAAGGFVR